MTKTDHPVPFRMTIQNGRLVPAQALDEERLATYRNGSSVSVIITQEKNRKLERKYWAILHRVVKTCPVRQRTAEDLHKAIRLKLGIVESFTTLSGAIKVELRSTSGMEDQEYSAFFEEAMELLSAETGVDVQTLYAESADVGDDEPGSTEPPSPSVETAGSEPDNPTSPGHSDDATDPAMPVEAGAEGQEQSEPAPASEYSRAACIKAFMRTATDNDLSIADRRDILEQSKDWWKENLPADLDFVRACLTTADKVAKGELQEGPARKYLEGLL